jgi:prepilin-type N-terminal cleavage/methylation domain-containing protein
MSLRQGAWQHEHGFTLIEVMVTIIIMGIVFAIASSTWFKVAESRRVDSATNQVVADLRLTHSQATNRLTDSNFVVPSDIVPDGVDPLSTYQVGPAGDLVSRTLPGDDQGTPKTKIFAATTITFHSDGRAEIDPAGDINITVTTTDDDPDEPFHTINVNTVTSRVTIVN